jgi:predicted ATPase
MNNIRFFPKHCKAKTAIADFISYCAKLTAKLLIIAQNNANYARRIAKMVDACYNQYRKLLRRMRNAGC